MKQRKVDRIFIPLSMSARVMLLKNNILGAFLTGYWTGDGTEDLLKKLVAENGAVMTGVAAAGPFSQYKG